MINPGNFKLDQMQTGKPNEKLTQTVNKESIITVNRGGI
jgi:hypothetical protein